MHSPEQAEQVLTGLCCQASEPVAALAGYDPRWPSVTKGGKAPDPHFEHLSATLHLSGNAEKAKESPIGQGMPITYNPKRYPGALL